MTVSECYAHVVKLVFEDEMLEDEGAFYHALQRAVHQVGLLRPDIGVYRIEHFPLGSKLTSASHNVEKKTGENVLVAGCGKAYTFEIKGAGFVYIECDIGGEWELCDAFEFSDTDKFIRYQGFIKHEGSFTEGAVRIRLVSDYLYYIRNAAVYAELLSGDASDIPSYTEHIEYDISELVPDFLSFESAPIISGERICIPGRDYDIVSGKTLLIPREAEGVFDIHYRKCPPAIALTDSGEDDRTALPFDEELCSLLPLLIASYVWGEDEPAKSQYYYALYRERASEIISQRKNIAPVKYNSVNNW